MHISASYVRGVVNSLCGGNKSIWIYYATPKGRRKITTSPKAIVSFGNHQKAHSGDFYQCTETREWGTETCWLCWSIAWLKFCLTLTSRVTADEATVSVARFGPTILFPSCFACTSFFLTRVIEVHQQESNLELNDLKSRLCNLSGLNSLSPISSHYFW